VDGSPHLPVERTTEHNNLAIDVPERFVERDHVLVRVAHHELDLEYSRRR